jgi:thymidylate synthase
MKEYMSVLEKILREGENLLDDGRTGSGTKKIDGHQLKWDLSKSFPIPTVRPVAWKGVLGETLTFLHGETNNRDFLKRHCSFWTPDAMRHNYSKLIETEHFSADEIKVAQKKAEEARSVMIRDSPLADKTAEANLLMEDAFNLQKKYNTLCLNDENFALECANLGPIYGAAWRGKYAGAKKDQIVEVEENLRNGGKSRRNIVTAWIPDILDDMALHPCHFEHQVSIMPETQRLDIEMTQRSVDTILGLLHNIPQYGLIGNLYAITHGYNLGTLTMNLRDTHIYIPHISIAEELLERNPPEPNAHLEIKNRRESITEYEVDDLVLHGYEKEDRLPALPYKIPMFGGLF